MHAWTITPGVNIFSTHIRANDLSKSQDILSKAAGLLKEKYGFYSSTIQIEKECVQTKKSADIDIIKAGGKTDAAHETHAA